MYENLVPIEQVYPNYDGYCESNYSPLLDSFGEILVQVDERGYSGDSFILFKSGERFGYLEFGWGSCSGCDGLQACQTLQEIDDLRFSLYNSVHWTDDAVEMRSYLENRDWATQWAGHCEVHEEFILKALEYLGK